MQKFKLRMMKQVINILTLFLPFDEFFLWMITNVVRSQNLKLKNENLKWYGGNEITWTNFGNMDQIELQN
jgi:hypothetical protein